MRFEYTSESSQDFIALCHELDHFLNQMADGEENRSQYVVHNQLDDIHDVILAYDNDIPVGCASFKEYSAQCAEVKRVFVRQEYRGKGISKSLMALLEKCAKEKGYSSLLLESGDLLVAAMELYIRIGFRVIPNCGQYKDMPESVCMRKAL